MCLGVVVDPAAVAIIFPIAMTVVVIDAKLLVSVAQCSGLEVDPYGR